MRWTLEMEEEFTDLKIVAELTKDRSIIKGNFEEGLYIRGKKAEFEKVSILDDKIKLYLPLNREKIENCGSKFAYPIDMGEYVEYVCEGGKYGFTFELYNTDDTQIDEVTEEFKYNVQEKYEYTIVDIMEQTEKEGHIVGMVMVSGEVNEEDMLAYVYIMDCFRMYSFGKNEDWKIVRKLASMIFEHIEIGR